MTGWDSVPRSRGGGLGWAEGLTRRPPCRQAWWLSEPASCRGRAAGCGPTLYPAPFSLTPAPRLGAACSTQKAGEKGGGERGCALGVNPPSLHAN